LNQVRSQFMPFRGFNDTAREGNPPESRKVTEGLRRHLDVPRRSVREGCSVKRQSDVPMVEERSLGGSLRALP
jgi:hypothetical protein